MKIFIMPIVCFVAVALLLAAPARSDDWPQWRGANREGVWREDGIVKRFPAAGLPAVWRTPIGKGFAGPVVAAGRVYVMDRVLDEDAPEDVKTQWNYRDKTLGRERVLCLDAATGKRLWAQAYPCSYSVAYGSGPRASPTVDGGKVFTLGAMGDMLCLDALTGKLIWQKNLPKDYGAEVPIYGYAGAPLVDGPRVIVVVGGEEHAVVAFDRNTGKELWRSGSCSEPGYCAPIVRTLGGRRQVIVWHADAINGLDPESGKILWTVPHHLMAGMAITTPAVEGDRLAVSTQYEGTMLVEVAPGAAEAKVLWKKMAAVSVPEKPFKKAGINTTLSTILLKDNYIYGVSCYGETCCLNAKSGRRLWTTLQPTSGGSEPHDRWSTAFFVQHGEETFIFNEKGQLILARLRPSGYEELSRTQIIEPDMSASGGGRKVVWSHPAFAERSIFARNNHEIVRVSLTEK